MRIRTIHNVSLYYHELLCSTLFLNIFKPDYLFVLIWSFRSEVIKQEKKFLLSGGKLILPLPIFHIIDKDNYKNYLNEDLNSLGYSI